VPSSSRARGTNCSERFSRRSTFHPSSCFVPKREVSGAFVHPLTRVRSVFGTNCPECWNELLGEILSTEFVPAGKVTSTRDL